MRSLLVSPILPAPGWGGLALRAWHWVHHLRRLGPVEVVVVPVSGHLAAPAARQALRRLGDVDVVELPVPDDELLLRRGVRLLGDPAARAFLQACDPLPVAARAAPTWLADDLAAPTTGGDAVGSPHRRARSVAPRLVVAFRDVMGPLGCEIAQRHAAPLVVDLDDDEVTFLAEADPAEAAAHARLVAYLASRAALLTVANPRDTEAVRRRYGSETLTVPNVVPRAPVGRVGHLGSSGAAPRRRRARALFVGNFTYAPNLDGLRWLASEVAPLLRRPLTVDVVGSGSRDAVGAAPPMPGGHSPGPVRLRPFGRVSDAELERRYHDADLVVAPLRRGSGTRLKVLEAFARARPVVATPLAVDGLDVVADHHALLAEHPAAFAAAIERVLDDDRLTARLVAAGRTLAARFDLDVVGADVARELTRITDGAVWTGDTMPSS